jgi:hypothetical protein
MGNSQFAHCAVCQSMTKQYRQCPSKECGLELVYCGQHGGDQRAMTEMTEHINTTHKKSEQ